MRHLQKMLKCDKFQTSDDFVFSFLSSLSTKAEQQSLIAENWKLVQMEQIYSAATILNLYWPIDYAAMQRSKCNIIIIFQCLLKFIQRIWLKRGKAKQITTARVNPIYIYNGGQ